MVTLHLDPAMADLESVSAKLSLRPQDVDKSFGVLNVSPDQNLYAILVSEEAANRIEGAQGVAGTFSNPRIETFGPPKPKRR
jgi:hypothetical protein